MTQRKLIIRNSQSPGDILMLSAAIRDLHKAHPGEFRTDLKTSAGAIWENNPYVETLNPYDPSVEEIKAEYPLVHQSNHTPYHFIHGFRKDLEQKIGVDIPPTEFFGDIHLSEEEKGWISQPAEQGYDGPFWIIVAGGKYDFTAKWWNPDWFQQVVDHFRGKIVFVQCGEKKHWHHRLNHVIDFIGKTDLRQFIRLMYHADGVLCPVTFAMHLAAAVPTKPGMPKNRPGVVVAGGREPAQWEAYPHHQFLSTNGMLPCCDQGGCWKSRTQKVGDGDPKDDDDKRCILPRKVPGRDLQIAKCMEMIEPKDVIRAIEKYYEGGVLQYQGT